MRVWGMALLVLMAGCSPPPEEKIADGRVPVWTLTGLAEPESVALAADGRTLYTANGPSGDVSVIDLATDTVQKRISTGGSCSLTFIRSARSVGVMPPAA